MKTESPVPPLTARPTQPTLWSFKNS